MHKKPTPKAVSPAFAAIQKRYGLKKPNQIKLRIIWHHLEALIRAQYPGKETDRRLAAFNRDFRTIELEQNKN